MPRINESLFSLLVSFRKFWISFDREFCPAIGSQRRTRHLPVKYLEFWLSLDILCKFECCRRSACLPAKGDLPFLDFKACQSHPIGRQEARDLIEHLDWIETGIHRFLNLSPSLCCLLDSCHSG